MTNASPANAPSPSLLDLPAMIASPADAWPLTQFIDLHMRREDRGPAMGPILFFLNAYGVWDQAMGSGPLAPGDYRAVNVVQFYAAARAAVAARMGGVGPTQQSVSNRCELGHAGDVPPGLLAFDGRPSRHLHPRLGRQHRPLGTTAGQSVVHPPAAQVPAGAETVVTLTHRAGR